LIQIAIGVFLPSIIALKDSQIKRILFAFCIWTSFNLEGGHFVLAPTAYAKLFGSDGGIRVFSVGFSFIGLAAILNILVMEIFLTTVGF
jgi:hypothetical protein